MAYTGAPRALRKSNSQGRSGASTSCSHPLGWGGRGTFAGKNRTRSRFDPYAENAQESLWSDWQTIWISAGPYARRYEKEFTVRLRIPVLPPDRSPTAQGVYEDAGLGHVETAEQGYRQKAAYAWLKEHEL